MHREYNDLKIYIHTWNIFANNISWRHITMNEQTVNYKSIYDYFDDLHHRKFKIILIQLS